MAIVSIRIDDRLKAQLDDLADRGLNVSREIREAILSRLEVLDSRRQTPGQLQLSVKDRLILKNQFSILAALYPEEQESYRKAQEILEYGYELDYQDLAGFTGRLSVESCQSVYATLQMFEALQRAQQDIGPGSDISEKDVTFPGYSGNEETLYMMYVRFIVQRNNSYTFIKTWGDDFNSHVPMVDAYHRMFREWRKSSDPWKLSAKDIRRILDARKFRRDED